MNLYGFIALSMDEQALTAWDGEFIATRMENDKKVLLYKVEEFYVEIFYDYTENRIIKLRPFKTKRLLEPYFDLNMN